MIAYFLGLFSGSTLPIQTSVNTKLGEYLRSPLLASIVSFTGGIFCTTVAILIMKSGFSYPWAELANEPIWIWFGGCCGFILVCFNMIGLPVLGSAQVVMICALGQIIGGVTVDSLGLFKAEVIPFTITKLVGAVLVACGVAIVSLQKTAILKEQTIEAELKEQELIEKKNLWPYRLLVLLGGISAGIQVGINGRLGIVTGDILQSTLVSMVVGLISAIAVCLVLLAVKGKSRFLSSEKANFKSKWWMYTGGIFALIAVASNVYLSHQLGAGLAVIVSLIGQMAGGLVIDASGFLLPYKKPVTGKKIIGIVIMLIGAMLVRLI